jgi:Domain of unknown function (DUF4389)
MDYPVTYEADYVEQRSRASAFFRGLLTLPLVLFGYLYMAAAGLAIACAWFAIVFTGRYPEGLYQFVSRFVRYLARFGAYAALMTDAYPAFSGEDDGAYPVRVEFAGPLAQYNRAKTFFRGLLAIPMYILRYVAQIAINLTGFCSWFMIVFTGKQSRGLFDLQAMAQSFAVRSDAYLYLLTEAYPPLPSARVATAVPAAV